jgi:NAD(P)H-hydrate epimerase
MLELLTAEEMAGVDARSEALGAPVRTLMENAGAAVAAAVRARWPRRPTVVLCGTGNNGGDGYVAARLLAEAGRTVRIAALGPAGTAAARDAAAAWAGPVEPLTEATVRDGELVIDALFGAGLNRPLEGAAAALASRIEATRVVAVDVPSGVTGDGSALGAAFAAALTVTFCRKKPAHVLYPARAHCGDIVLAEIGVPEQAVREANARAWENDPDLWRAKFPWPEARTHKHKRGSVGVASGGPTRTGAARLAARAALRAGAGLTTLCSPPEALAVNAAHLTAVMLASFANEAELAELAARCDAFVLGPAYGLGEGVRRAVKAVASLRKPLVLDADALTGFADAPEDLFAVLHEQCVLTPHEGEFARLFGDIAKRQDSKLSKARAAAARAGCVVLLKGPDTVIAAPDGRAAVNTHSTPHLATAGAGDVLAGVIAGLGAQAMTIWDAACAAAWLHGDAGRVLGPGLIAEDLCEALPSALRALQIRESREFQTTAPGAAPP